MKFLHPQPLTENPIPIRVETMFETKDISILDLEEEDFDTILASDIFFSGEIKFEEPFMIKGKVDGRIEATSDLVVDVRASVTADIVADRVLVRGKVQGNIDAKQIVFVAATGSVIGDISSAEIALEPGCHFSGKCTMVK